MGTKIELEDSDIRIIEAFCDIALKSGGLAYLNAASRLISILPKNEEEKKE